MRGASQKFFFQSVTSTIVVQHRTKHASLFARPRFIHFSSLFLSLSPLFILHCSMSVVLRSASISLNDSSFKKRLSVDRPPTKSLSTELSPSLKSEHTLKASVQEKTKPILVVVPKATSKRKPLKDITTKICRTLSQSVASCQASVRLAFFIIFFLVPKN